MYKVLIVDDERMIREGLKASIDWQKFMISDVLLAKDGVEGKDMILTHEPDLVITDIKMPRMNGIEMMEATQAVAYEKIILSSYDDFEYAKAGIHFKVMDYLLKPIDEEALEALLAELQCCAKKTVATVPDILKPVIRSDYDHYYITEAVQYIKTHLQAELDNDIIAASLDISTSYLMRTFKQHTGLTVKDYINRYRIYCSLTLLKQHLKIYEVAERVGYNEYKAFSYNFQKYMKMTPNQYIKS